MRGVKYNREVVDPSPHFQHFLPQYSGSYAYISGSEEVDTAAIFVHGFFGDATKTWYDFQHLVDVPACRDKWIACDLFFFQYSSVWAHIHANSFRLQRLVADLYPRPKRELFSLDLRTLGFGLADAAEPQITVLPAERNYKRVLLVGHSEGGVIIRQALLTMIQGRTRAAAGDENASVGGSEGGHAPPPALDGAVRLFAPALFGYRPSGLLGALARSPFVGRFVDWVLSSTSSAFQDLSDPRELLSSLQAQTETLASSHAILRASILWGENEHVLKTGQYQDDAIVEFVPGGTHTSICKPRPDFLRPLEFCRP